MEYLSTYDWQSGQECASLVLQQMQYGWSRCSALFGCLCATDAMAEELLGWWERKGLALPYCAGEVLDAWAKELEAYAEQRCRRQTGQEQNGAWSGVLCVEHEFLLFQGGQATAYVINTRFGRSHIRPIGQTGEQDNLREGAEWKVLRGRLEKGVGILLANQGFLQGISMQQLQEVLVVQELRTEEQLERRLRELGHYGTGSGATNEQGRAAILLVAR